MSETLALEAKGDPGRIGGLSKVDRYRWKLRGEPGEFAMLSKHELQVDPVYQRETKQSKARRVAADWSWVACGAISVSLRETDGELQYWVIDGGHRVSAALMRSDINQLPCLVYQMDDMVAEARGFLEINVNRRPMSTVDRFRAMLVEQHPGALAVQALMASIGRHPGDSSKKDAISCIGELLHLQDTNPQVLRDLFPLMDDLSRGRVFHKRLVAGLFYLETMIRKEGDSLISRRWATRLNAVGYDELMRNINEACAFLGAGSGKSAGVGILRIVNKGLQNRLEIPGVETGVRK